MPGVTPVEVRRALVLAIDIGSSSVRALLYDARAQAVASIAAFASSLVGGPGVHPVAIVRTFMPQQQ